MVCWRPLRLRPSTPATFRNSKGRLIDCAILSFAASHRDSSLQVFQGCQPKPSRSWNACDLKLSGKRDGFLALLRPQLPCSTYI